MYYLEKLIKKHEKEKTLPFFIKKFYLSHEFYKKGEVTNGKLKNFIDALEFLNKELKKGGAATLQ